uniref:ADP-ribosyl cyclase/cyclic ADP-ribose hydrolase n=1 Tax=Anas zonorhyncha TaxID=75864 RepID=A0A8B9VI20_9AVES
MKSLFLSLLLVSILFMNSFSEVRGRKWKGEGTTQNLESIFIGRCYDYIRIVNPAVGEKNCLELWEAFRNAFINKHPCNILPKDYELFIKLAFHTIPANKSLFWENNQLLVKSFTSGARRYMSLSDALFGFVADFLIWCGQANSTGLDYESCPTMEECENNAVDSFWRMASITYAQHSSGVIHVLLNGSAEGGAYPVKGFFADYEIPNLQKDKISKIVIWVVDDIQGPDRDSCGKNTVKILEDRLKALGYDVTCTDNYKPVLFLLCVDYPDDSNCILSSRDTDCLKIWESLKYAFIYKNPCNTTAEDYQPLMELASHPIPCNKSLFWSKTNDLAHRYTKSSHGFLTLEDTLLGYMFDGVSWCGDPSVPGINYESCPKRSECESNPGSVFWKTASKRFAEAACGVVQVMLNGSIEAGAFRSSSIFGSIEVFNLNPDKVSEIQIWLMHDIGGPQSESCSGHSIQRLKRILEERNFTITCEDNYRPVQLLQCVRNPDHEDCRLCPSSMETS